MGDNVADPFDDIDSEEELEKPPTPEFHHGGDSPEAPTEFSDISDNEREETAKKEAAIEPSEEGNDSGSENTPGAKEKSAKDDDEIEETQQEGSPIYDQEISPISSTAGDENTSDKVEEDVPMKEDEPISVAAKISEETTSESTLESTKSKQEHSEGNVEEKNKASGLVQSAVTGETTEETEERKAAGDSTDNGSTTDRRRRISSGAGTDDDFDMPISPLGLGLSGTESELVEDILKSDVSKLLPDVEEDYKEESMEHKDDEEDTKEDKSLTETEPAEPTEQDEEGSESGEEAGEQLIADIFGASDEEEEFVGFGQEDIEVTKKKKGARDRKHHSLSVGSEVDDEEGKSSQDIDVEKMVVPKPKAKAKNKGADSDSDEDGLDDRSVFVSDFDLMIQKKKEMNKSLRRKRKNVDIISDSDDAIAHMITKMKEAVEEDQMLNGAKQAATKKLKMFPTVLCHLQKADLQMTFLDLGVLTVLKDWLSPLPDGSLPHLQIREGLLKILNEFPPMDGRALKMSGIGKAVMYLCRHPKETRENKKMAGKLINEWARPIFGVTSNFKSLSREEREKRDYQNMSKKRRLSSVDSDGGKTPKSIDSALQSEKKAVRPGDKGFVMRARVPMPSNKDYVVRPQHSVEVMDFNRKPQKSMNRFEKQKRKFDEKKKLLSRGSQRAVGISIEGRKMGL